MINSDKEVLDSKIKIIVDMLVSKEITPKAADVLLHYNEADLSNLKSIASMLMSFEAEEKKQQSQKIKHGLRESLRNWSYIGGMEPLGFHYNQTTKEYELDCNGAMLVNLIFRKFLEEGCSKACIANELDTRGFRTPEGYRKAYKAGVEVNKVPKTKKWSPSTIHRILTNPIYTGCVYYGRTQTDCLTGKRYKAEEQDIIREYNPVFRIISDEVFQEVQMIIKQKSKGIN